MAHSHVGRYDQSARSGGGGADVVSPSRTRAYHPGLGRWATRDPASYVDGANLYQYVRSAPIDATDLDGRRTYVEETPAAVTFHVSIHFFWDKCDIANEWYDVTSHTAEAQAERLADLAQFWWDDMLEPLRLLRPNGVPGGFARKRIAVVIDHKFTVLESTTLLNEPNPRRASSRLTREWYDIAGFRLAGLGSHLILLHPGGEAKNRMSYVDTLAIGGINTTGQWHWGDPRDGMPAHEVAHLLGMADKYNTQFVTLTGWHGNLMAIDNGKSIRPEQIVEGIRTVDPAFGEFQVK